MMGGDKGKISPNEDHGDEDPHWCVINFTDEADRLCFKIINNNKRNEVEHIKITHMFFTHFLAMYNTLSLCV